MDPKRQLLYESCMIEHQDIPSFALFGESEDFPDVIHCEQMVDRAQHHDWIIRAHRHSNLAQLFIIEKGAGSARLDGKELRLQDQTFIYVPKRCVHAFHVAAATVGHVFSFPHAIEGNAMPGSPQEALLNPITGALDHSLKAVSGLLMEAIGSTGLHRTLRIRALSEAMLAMVAEKQPSAAIDTRLREFDRLLLVHSGDGWRPRDYAEALCVTVGHLSRLCRRATGQGAGAYVEAFAMSEACRLLAFTRLSVAEVGYRLGFADPAYFSRRFRKSQGASPSDYRARFGS